MKKLHQIYSLEIHNKQNKGSGRDTMVEDDQAGATGRDSGLAMNQELLARLCNMAESHFCQ